MVDTIAIYRSPVRLVLHASEATTPYSPQAFHRARKRLMAEISLGGDEVIIDDIPYTRNDAATLLDDISEEAWRVHCTIYTYPGLLAFLEKSAFDHEALKKADAHLYDQRFINVVSPYFAYSFNVAAGSLLRQGAFDELEKLLTYQGYLLPEHQHEAFQKIRHYLDELSYTLRNLSWEKFIADESMLHFLFEEGWQRFINALPPSFNTLRDEVVDHLIQLVLRFQQKATWYYLHQVLVNLRNLETNEYNRHEIKRIDEVIFANTKLEGKGGKPKKDDEVSTGRFIWWGVWIVLMVIRAATCNDKSNKSYDDLSRFRYTPASEVQIDNAVEKQNERFLLMSLDSALEKKSLAGKPLPLKTGDQPFEFFGEDPRMAKNDSLTISNNTGLDAVFFYFKDLPGHNLSGTLPKLYSTFIKNGESERVYVLAGNGRIYFAFGKNWTELKTPLRIPLPHRTYYGGEKPRMETADLAGFFSSDEGLKQHYLTHPLYLEHPDAPKDEGGYRYINISLRLKDPRETRLTLTRVGDNINIKASGRLTVKEDLSALRLAETSGSQNQP